jgi:hypothetical protein
VGRQHRRLVVVPAVPHTPIVTRTTRETSY